MLGVLIDEVTHVGEQIVTQLDSKEASAIRRSQCFFKASQGGGPQLGLFTKHVH